MASRAELDQLAFSRPRPPRDGGPAPRGSFCAVCIDNPGSVLRPVGRNDALVAVCGECDLLPIPEPDLPNHVVTRKDPLDARAVRIREHRQRLKAAGICTNGENHGKATRGTLCERCWSREQKRNESRKMSS